jgi:hypothetical protein
MRLGALLTDARSRTRLSVEDLAAASGGQFAVADLLDVEAGGRDLSDRELEQLTLLYGLTPGELVPERARLVIDLEQRTIGASGHRETLTAPTADEVLATYLSLVYTMRNTVPGTPVPLRSADIDVLSRALELAGTDVEARLVDLMADPDQQVSSRTGLWRRRFLLPVAGIVIAVTAVGTIILVTADDEPTTTTAPASTEQPGDIPTDASVGPAVVQEREADGAPGQVSDVQPPPTVVGDDTLSGDAVAPGEVGLIDPLVVERLPDGATSSGSPQVADPDASSTTTTTGG